MTNKNKKNKIKISFVDSPSSEDVTGSSVYIETPNHKILLDCGLHQTNDKYEDFLVNNRKPKEFKSKDIDLIFLLHNHGDHVLKTPKLFKEGCNAEIVVPCNTKGVFKDMLADCSYINERDVLIINNQYNKKYEPLYSMKDVENTLEHTIEFPINEKIQVDEEISFKLVPSGHLLGACQLVLYITVEGITKTIGYTSDIGSNRIHNYFVGEFTPIKDYCDIFIGESTYGDRPDLKTGKKERKNDLEKLKTIIDTQVKDMHGKVVIPSFAQSRIQQLALMIYELYKNEEWQPKVYIDSPLAITIFKEYQQVLEGEEKELFDKMLNWENLIFVRASEDSMALVESDEPNVVLSTAGMCQVGRIRHHLKKLIPNPNATILFVGYSTQGSLATLLRDNKTKTVTMDTKVYPCRCSAFSLKSMSGHATFKQLLEYYSEVNCGRIVLHHGSTSAKETLAKELKLELEKRCKTNRVTIANSSLKINLL